MRHATFAVLLCAALPAAGQSMDAGLWEFSSTLSSPALPKPQSATVQHCLTKEDADNPTGIVSGPATQKCKITPGPRTPDSFQWTIACPEQRMTGDGKLRYTPRSLEADINMVVEPEPGQKMSLKTVVSGRLLGPCQPK
jgi:hypothetical protein